MNVCTAVDAVGVEAGIRLRGVGKQTVLEALTGNGRAVNDRHTVHLGQVGCGIAGNVRLDRQAEGLTLGNFVRRGGNGRQATVGVGGDVKKNVVSATSYS